MTLYPVLVFDTETSGMFDFKRPADAQGQPRMAALSAALLLDDESEPFVFTSLVKPDGWVMSPEATEKNGLTTERLHAEGVPIKSVLDVFDDLYQKSEILSAFNINFDTKVLRAEWRRDGQSDRFGEKFEACVMRAARPLCGLGKNPTLTEACRILLDEDHPGAHEAEADTLKTAALYRYLATQGAIVPAYRPSRKG